mmetsp:Transcript_10538/g.47954  ORF Transcript_10538/g.47954 Transcript_10538/m.47954 type:complete len:226 (+) Transcript_10538:1445-2122(+)
MTETNTTGKTAATTSLILLGALFFRPPFLLSYVWVMESTTDRLTRTMVVAAAVEKLRSAPMPTPSSTHNPTSATYHAPVTSPAPWLVFTRLVAWNSPLSPLRTVCTSSDVMCAPATTSCEKNEDTKHCRMSCPSTSHLAARSSRTKSTPPMGELKAALIPLLTPHVTRCVRRWDLLLPRNSPTCSRASVTYEATIAPMWIMGPSRPTGAPAAMTMHTPMLFTQNV